MEKKIFNVSPDVLRLGVVSFLTDVSSESIFAIFSVFFTVIVGASASLLGIIEGLADFSASSLDYLAGWLSDRSGKRKRFALIGYGFSTFAKFLLLVSTSVAALAAFRIIERLGKSFRGPPRDAWLDEMTDESTKGYAFGVHRAMDKSGAILGPLVAYFLLVWLGQGMGTFQIIFAVAIATAGLSVLVLASIGDRPGPAYARENMFKAWGVLSPQFKRYLFSASIFSLAYFSFGFLLLKAYAIGFAIQDVVLLYALFHVSFVLFSIPIGKLGDVIGRKYLIMASYAIYLLMSVGFIFATEKWEVIILFLVYGIFFSISDAQNTAFITDLEQERKATAIGLYGFVTGLFYLPASAIAGALWILRPAYAFSFAALIALSALLTFLYLKPWMPRAPGDTDRQLTNTQM